MLFISSLPLSPKKISHMFLNESMYSARLARIPTCAPIWRALTHRRLCAAPLSLYSPAWFAKFFELKGDVSADPFEINV